MTGTADPCPHVLPCGACIDCCERDHDHDKETGVRENIGIRMLAGYRQQPELAVFDADGKRVRPVLVVEEELSRYWHQADGKPSPAAERLMQIVWEGRHR
jgi:hypothetical protein